MQVNSVNNYQNFGGASKMIQKAANHIKNNVGHYVINIAGFTGGAMGGHLNSAEGIFGTKIMIDTLETISNIFCRRKDMASFSNPRTNIMLWYLKGIAKMFNIFFPDKPL